MQIFQQDKSSGDQVQHKEREICRRSELVLIPLTTILDCLMSLLMVESCTDFVAHFL